MHGAHLYGRAEKAKTYPIGSQVHPSERFQRTFLLGRRSPVGVHPPKNTCPTERAIRLTTGQQLCGGPLNKAKQQRLSRLQRAPYSRKATNFVSSGDCERLPRRFPGEAADDHNVVGHACCRRRRNRGLCRCHTLLSEPSAKLLGLRILRLALALYIFLELVEPRIHGGLQTLGAHRHG